MTREELREHCEKQIEMCEFWAIGKGEKPSGKIYEEHKLILELLEQANILDNIRADILAGREMHGQIDPYTMYIMSGEQVKQMTLEETIKYEEELAKEKQEQADSNIQFERNGIKFLYDGEEYRKCFECAKEHKQLAEWLKDYKRLLEQDNVLDNIRSEIEQTADEEQKHDEKWAIGLRYAIKIINKYRGEDTTQEITNKSPNKKIKTIEEIEKEMEDGDVYTVEEFEMSVNNGFFIPSDGSGYYHDGVSETDISVWSSDKIDTSYPYVCWYNK